MGVYSRDYDLGYLLYTEDDAINDKGLYIGLNFALMYKWSYGLKPPHMIRLIAENCENVDEALEIIKKVPLCYPKFFFIADRSGNMAVVEHDSKKAVIRKETNDILIMTNHFIDGELKKEDKILAKYPDNNTKLRYEDVSQKIESKKYDFNFPDIIEILGDVNSYACQDEQGLRSIWSLSLDMQNGKYKLTYDLFDKRKEIGLAIR